MYSSKRRHPLSHRHTALCATAIGLLLSACTFTGRQASFNTNRDIPVRYGYRTSDKYVGSHTEPRPLKTIDTAAHPFMAAGASNNMHVDGRATDRTPLPGPLGQDPQVKSRSLGVLGGQCASANFDSNGRILAVCINFTRPRLLLLDPNTFDVLARYDLPKRVARSPFSIRKIVSDTSGGAYFYVDHEDRVVLATSTNRILRIGQHEQQGNHSFVVEDEFDVDSTVSRPGAEDDRITTVLPDWNGNLWFETQQGLVGYINPETQRIETMVFPDEAIQNSFAVAQDGVYVVSNHALYRIQLDDAGEPQIVWREAYDRGSDRKPGMLGRGSGTTPTLMGNRYIAIADNADPRINILVYDRLAPDNRLVCTEPVFENGRSATENSLVGYGNSLVVENNYGYKTFMSMTRGKTSEPGIWRIDIDPQQGDCQVVWKSDETSPTTVPKLSTANGLLYFYTKNPDRWRLIDAFYLTAVDFRTGETVYKVLTGTGMKFDNNWAAISIGPDGAVYVGVLNGLVKVSDNDAPVAVADETEAHPRTSAQP